MSASASKAMAEVFSYATNPTGHSRELLPGAGGSHRRADCPAGIGDASARRGGPG